MNTLALDIGLAVWFGILTSISPCPLATNVTAISFIGRRVDRIHRVLLAGLLYTAGRMAAYIALGVVLVAGIEYMPPVANFLQTYMIYLIGPVLIVIGLLLLDLFRINFPGGGVMWDGMQRTVERLGIWGALLMGVVFALSFCPVSAGTVFRQPVCAGHQTSVDGDFAVRLRDRHGDSRACLRLCIRFCGKCGRPAFRCPERF